MSPNEIRNILERAIHIDSNGGPGSYVNIHDGDEILSVCAFATGQEARAQRELLIQTLVSVLSKG